MQHKRLNDVHILNTVNICDLWNEVFVLVMSFCPFAEHELKFVNFT